MPNLRISQFSDGSPLQDADNFVIERASADNYKVSASSILGYIDISSNYITALTGDVTATGPGSVAATLATVNSNVGTFGTGSQVGTFTVDAKGRITAASMTSIAIGASQVTGLTVGKILFGSSTGNIGQAITFVWDNTNNRLGVNTDTPQYKLEVISSSNTYSQFHDTASAKGGLVFGKWASNADTFVARGAEYDGTNWTARQTSASIIRQATNSLIFYTNTSLTIGNTFTPTEAFRFDGNRKFIINTGAPVTGSLGEARFQLESDDVPAIQVRRTSANSTAPSIETWKRRSGNTILNNSDSVGQWRMSGANGTSTPQGVVNISGFVDGISGSNMGGRIVFQTSTTGATLTEAMRINASQQVLIGGTSPIGSEKLSVTGTAYVSGSYLSAGDLQTAYTTEYFDNNINIIRFGADSGFVIDGTPLGIFWSNIDVGQSRFEFRTEGGTYMGIAASTFYGSGSTLDTNSIGNAQLRQSVARSVVGRSGNTTGNVADIQGTADQVLVINGAGTSLAFGTVATGGITNNAVTFAKMQTLTGLTVLCNPTSSSGNIQALSGSADGNALVRSGTTLVWGPIQLAGGSGAVSGILPIANGGTNASSFGTSNGYTYYDGTRLVNSAALLNSSSTLDVVFGGISVKVGADSNLTTRTNNTTKFARVGAAHYANAEEPTGMVYATIDATTAQVFIGGGNSLLNAATKTFIYGASNNTTTTGTELAAYSTSEIVFNETGANQDFRVEGDTNANLLFVDASADFVGIGKSAPSSRLHVATSAGASNQVVTLEQGDSSYSFVDWVGTSTASDPASVVASITTYNPAGDDGNWSQEGWLLQEVNGTAAKYVRYWTYCVTGDTIIDTPEGQRRIDSLNVGDEVNSWDNKRKKVVPSQIIEVEVHPNTPDYYVINNVLKITGNHKVFIDGTWKPAENILIGDRMLGIDGRPIFVDSIEYVDDQDITTYNIKLEKVGTDKNYFANGYCIHNAKCPRIDAWINGEWVEVGRAIMYLDGPEKEGQWDIILPYPMQKFRMVEDEPEISYVKWIRGDGENWGLGEVITSPASEFGATDGSVHEFEFLNPVARLETYGYYEQIRGDVDV